MQRRRQVVQRLLAVVGAAIFSAPTLAQTNGTYLIDVSGVASPSNPTVHVEIWAAWIDPFNGFVFGLGNYDLVADDGVFSNGVTNQKINLAAINTPGTAQGRTVMGASIQQFHLPNFGIGIYDNPLFLASYDWTATDFAPRPVSLVTNGTDSFLVIESNYGMPTQLFPAQFTPGSGIITVVPSPVAFPLFGAALFAVRRRRSGDGG